MKTRKLSGCVASLKATDVELAPVIGLSIVALTMFGMAMVGYVRHAELIDFRGFDIEGRAFLAGQPLYAGRMNLNTPALTALVFAPLALVPYAITQVLWLALGLASFSFGVMAIGRELHWSMRRTVLLASVLCLTHAGFQNWAIGQVVWPLLFYPVTRAWMAYRHGELRAAGLWLGLAIAAKPPLALLALLLPFPVWLTAGLLSAVLSVATVPLTGFEPWFGWLRQSSDVTLLGSTFNASLWGMAARLHTGSNAPIGMSQLSVVAVCAVLVVGVALWYQTMTQCDPDTRFAYAGLLSTLLSPLGWAYYLLLIAGPVSARWKGSWWLWAALAFSLIPVGDNPPGSGVLFGSCMFAAAILWWGGVGSAVSVSAESRVTRIPWTASGQENSA